MFIDSCVAVGWFQRVCHLETFDQNVSSLSIEIRLNLLYS